jgi:non-ribosomal peptide synthetase component F
MALSLLPFHESEITTNIGERFNRVAAHSPERTAIRTSRRELTFHELDAMASRLARLMASQLNGGQQPVAFLLNDSTDCIAALLGVIRAGQFYCALSPKDPPAYLAATLKDLSAPILIAESATSALAGQILPSDCRLLDFSEIQGWMIRPLNSPLHQKQMRRYFTLPGRPGFPKGY